MATEGGRPPADGGATIAIMGFMTTVRNKGVQAALVSAVLFGVGTPFAKLLLPESSPWLMAGLLYLGSGILVSAYVVFRQFTLGKAAPVLHISRNDFWPLAGAILSGGIIAPVLMMFGLAGSTASSTSLLLNAEIVFTTVLAWTFYKENYNKRVVWGIIAILAGMLILSWPTSFTLAGTLPSILIIGACFFWGLDNNLTRKVALNDAALLTAIKGISAGAVNLTLALSLGAALPAAGIIMGAMVLGSLSYGLSFALFVVALRYVGTARAGAYFSIAPFFGALVSLVVFSLSVTPAFVIAALLMAVGVWLHLTESHKHRHRHEAITHTHSHVHDDGHHNHAHENGFHVTDGRHTHQHTHEVLEHEHEHFPDSHHRHTHVDA